MLGNPAVLWGWVASTAAATARPSSTGRRRGCSLYGDAPLVTFLDVKSRAAENLRLIRSIGTRGIYAKVKLSTVPVLGAL